MHILVFPQQRSYTCNIYILLIHFNLCCIRDCAIINSFIKRFVCFRSGWSWSRFQYPSQTERSSSVQAKINKMYPRRTCQGIKILWARLCPCCNPKCFSSSVFYIYHLTGVKKMWCFFKAEGKWGGGNGWKEWPCRSNTCIAKMHLLQDPEAHPS